LDYTIGSVHLVKNKKSGELWFIDGPIINYTSGLSSIFDNNIKLAVTSFYEQTAEMISTQKPTIIGHFDKVKMHNRNRFFKETESWYKKLVKQTLDVVEKSGSIVEVNTRGIYKKRCDSLYPGEEILKEILKLKIPITISADAHELHELTAYYPETISLLKDMGFKKLKYFTGKTWDDYEISTFF
ncbi:MAG: histidinol phosphatase, partial [Bacteroidetes bacterium]|nr:histidinol phosphatase [Bacteroidota bacterium]